MGPQRLPQGKIFYACRALAGEILRARASWPGPGACGGGCRGGRAVPRRQAVPARGCRQRPARRGAHALKKSGGRSGGAPTPPPQARIINIKKPGTAAEGPPGLRRPETAATSPPGLHRPGTAATRPGSTRPWLLAAQAHHRGPRRLPRRGSLADRAARRPAGMPSVSPQKGSILHTRFPDGTPACAAACRVRLSASAPCGAACAPPCCLKSVPPRFVSSRWRPRLSAAYAVQGGFYSFFYVFGQGNTTYHIVLFDIFQMTPQGVVPDYHFCARNIDKPINGV